MAIKLTAKFNVELADELEAYFDTIGQRAQSIIEDTVTALEPRVLETLKQTPGSPSYPIEWTSERQRRAYFATDGFGNGIPYRRTGSYAAGWFVESEVQGAMVMIRIGNRTDYAQFVGGSLNQRSVREARRYQQPMHRNTGWLLAVNAINPFLELVREQYLESIKRQYGEFVKTTLRRRSRIR